MAARTPASILHEVKRALRDKYAWPGGYPLYIIMADGEALSIDAARDNWREIVWATLRPRCDRQWEAIGADINWEDGELYCAHSNKRIESAYAEPEEEEESEDQK